MKAQDYLIFVFVMPMLRALVPQPDGLTRTLACQSSRQSGVLNTQGDVRSQMVGWCSYHPFHLVHVVHGCYSESDATVFTIVDRKLQYYSNTNNITNKCDNNTILCLSLNVA